MNPNISYTNTKIAFIGGGNMAQAILHGLKQRQFLMSNITVIELDSDKQKQLKQTFAVHVTNELAAVSPSDVIILAIKPQQLRSVAQQLTGHLSQHIVISIAAGIKTIDLSRWLNGYTTLIRSMPNTPAQIQAGITGMYATNAITEIQKKLATDLLQAVGEVLWLENEAQLDAVTAISGSGPAYVFLLIEALTEAGIALGLSTMQAQQLSKATFKGASLLASQSPLAVSSLREQVTSKGGTTEQGLLSLQQDHIHDIFKRAASQAAKRAVALGKELGESH